MRKHYTYIYFDTRFKWNYTCTNKWFSITFNYKPIYVGKGIRERYLSHLMEAYENKDNNSHKCNVIRKIKIETGNDPVIEKVLKNVSNKESIRLEKFLIELIGRQDLGKGPLLNKTSGGEGALGRILTEFSRKKISQSLIKYFEKNEVSDETRKKLSKTLKGKKLPLSWCKNISKGKKGKPLSDSHKKQISKTKLLSFRNGMKQWNTGIPHSLETREKIRKANLGQKRSLEFRQKCRENKNFKGKHHTKETREILSKKFKGKTWEEIYGVERARERRLKRVKNV